MTDPTPITAVALPQPVVTGTDLVPHIDVDRERQRLDQFRAFVGSVLERDKGHYGTMPGVKKDFLQQPGAEIIYRALDCRPRYTVVESEVHPSEDYCYFLVKAEVIHIPSGSIVGEDFGACSSLEASERCYLVDQRSQQGPSDVTVNCPSHGVVPGRFYRPRNGNPLMSCSGRNQPGLDRTLQPTQSKAKKRAMVAAIRTVGCVSEIFSQDQEFVDDYGDEHGAPPPKATRKPAAKKSAPKPAAEPERSPVEWCQAAFAAVKEAGMTGIEVRIFFEDAGTIEVGGPISVGALLNWCDATKKTPADWTKLMVERFKSPDEPAIEGEFSEVSEPTEAPAIDPDDLPFE